MSTFQCNGEVEMISKDSLFTNNDTSDRIPDIILPHPNISSYIASENSMFQNDMIEFYLCFAFKMSIVS